MERTVVQGRAPPATTTNSALEGAAGTCEGGGKGPTVRVARTPIDAVHRAFIKGHVLRLAVGAQKEEGRVALVRCRGLRSGVSAVAWQRGEAGRRTYELGSGLNDDRMAIGGPRHAHLRKVCDA